MRRGIGVSGFGEVPNHLRVTFQVEDEHGEVLALGKELDAVKTQLRGDIREVITEVAPTIETPSSTTWTFGTIPRVVETERGGQPVKAYPALVPEGTGVALRVFPSAGEQADAMWDATRTLVSLAVASPRRLVERALASTAKLALAYAPHESTAALVDDCIAAALDQRIADAGGPAWDERAFTVLRDAVRDDLAETALAIGETVGRILVVVSDVVARLEVMTSPRLQGAVDDVRAQLERLVFSGFVAAAGADRLGNVERYVTAMQRRLEKLPTDSDRDRAAMQRIHALERDYDTLLATLSPSAAAQPDVEQVGWTLEELRVSLFSQALGTAVPVSEKRIRVEIERLRAQR
jgi:ATP-dependent helicase HrpA